VNVGVQDTYGTAVNGEGGGQVSGQEAFANASLATHYGDNEPDLGQAVCHILALGQYLA
jgi:hypothetical protein